MRDFDTKALGVLPPAPTIDVLISTHNEEDFVGRCLDRVLGQDYPGDKVRVWLIDGGSTDRTLAVARERERADARLEVVAPGSRLNLPEALNLGLERSEGELVAKIDAHGYPHRDYLRRAVDAFLSAEADVACVGGRPEQVGVSRVGRALALARTSRFGVGSSGYAGREPRVFTDTVQCGVYRRAPLIAVGAFDPAMPYGEDEELNWRLRLAGLRILLDTRVRFVYVTRSSLLGAYRQYRNYGEARVRVVVKHPGFLRPHHLAPAALVATLASLTAASPFSRGARTALASVGSTYLAASLAAASRACGRAGEARTPTVAVCFAALHLGYGVGTLRGAWRALRGRGGRRSRAGRDRGRAGST